MISIDGLIVETLQRTGQLDPVALLSLPEEWQILHLAHTRSLFIGRYEPPAKGYTEPTADQPHRQRLGSRPPDLKQWRQRDRSGDVETARELLARPDLPPHLRRSAEATLRVAGET